MRGGDVMRELLRTVHVNAYIRFRLGRFEYVREHWRSLPCR